MTELQKMKARNKKQTKYIRALKAEIKLLKLNVELVEQSNQTLRMEKLK